MSDPNFPRTRPFLLTVMALCAFNYLMHLFPVSLLAVLGLYPADFGDKLGGAEGAEVADRVRHLLAGLEFAAVLMLQAVLNLLCAAFIFGRELFNLIRRGRNALLLAPFDYFVLTAFPLLLGVVLLEFSSGGLGAFAASKLSRLPFSIVMFLFGLMQMGSLVVALQWCLEPEFMLRTRANRKALAASR